MLLDCKSPSTRTPKRYFSGTHRSISPAETWARIAPRLTDFGITRVADITGLDRIGIPVATAIRPMSRSIAVAAGKGADTHAARVSAAMEAIECAHAERIERPLFYGSRSELAGRRPVDVTGLPQLQGGNANDHTRIVWIEGNDLSDGAPVLLPYEIVHAHYVPHGLAGSGIFLATTNGLSSGNALAEAICHGLFEVIERDALSRWSRKPPAQWKACRLDHMSLAGSGLTDELIQRLEHSGFAVAIWDITSDIPVPAFHCVIVDEKEPDSHPGTGTGCHPDKEVALARAIFEAVQVRATYISGGRDDLARREYQSEQLQSFRRLISGDDRGPPSRRFSDVPSRTAEFFEDDISWTINELDRAGLDPPIFVDLSWDRSDIPVVRVVVPGLEGPPAENVRLETRR